MCVLCARSTKLRWVFSCNSNDFSLMYNLASFPSKDDYSQCFDFEAKLFNLLLGDQVE